MTRIRSTLVTALLLVGSAVATAQMPGGSSMGIGRSPQRNDPAMKEIGAGLELRLANGVNIVIAHARDLSLTSEQLGRIVVIKRHLDSLNTPMMRALDSLEHESHERKEIPRSRGDLPDVDDPAVVETLDHLRTNLHNAELDAYDVLSGTQLQRAMQMVKEARTNAALAAGRDKAPN
jgi:hypothetical protein